MTYDGDAFLQLANLAASVNLVARTIQRTGRGGLVEFPAVSDRAEGLAVEHSLENHSQLRIHGLQFVAHGGAGFRKFQPPSH